MNKNMNRRVLYIQKKKNILLGGRIPRARNPTWHVPEIPDEESR